MDLLQRRGSLASVSTDSFISAASFHETTRVLTEAPLRHSPRVPDEHLVSSRSNGGSIEPTTQEVGEREEDLAASARRKAYRHVVLPLFLTSTVAYLDRVNISYAALTMNADLGFEPRVFGIGAGIVFAGYFFFEVPGALVAERYSPRSGWRES